MQPIFFYKLVRPIIETNNSRFSRYGRMVCFTETRLGVESLLTQIDKLLVIRPNRWMRFQISFEVGTPKHLLDKLFRSRSALVENCLDNLLLGN